MGKVDPNEAPPVGVATEAVHGCAGRVEEVMDWISVDDRLPPEREAPYQVIVVCRKKHGGQFEGLGVRRFIQDWVVRRWPLNFTHWMDAPPWPDEAPSQASAPCHQTLQNTASWPYDDMGTPVEVPHA